LFALYKPLHQATQYSTIKRQTIIRNKNIQNKKCELCFKMIVFLKLHRYFVGNSRVTWMDYFYQDIDMLFWVYRNVGCASTDSQLTGSLSLSKPLLEAVLVIPAASGYRSSRIKPSHLTPHVQLIIDVRQRQELFTHLCDINK
jgi:hypothetical protein